MAGRIQRFPAPLLPLLSIKSDESPNLLGGEVQPGLEMLAFYLAERLEVVSATQAGVSTVTFLYIPVPAGEYWFLHSITAAAGNITVGSSVELTVGISDQANVNAYLDSMQAPRVTTSAAETVLQSGMPSQPILLKPGMKIFGGTMFPPTSIDLTVRALIARLTPT